ncbi:MAG: four-helix bundle copper-binding protein [Chthoniobacteraceae bacterium]
MSHHAADPKLEECIKECLNCHHICLEMAMNHCLKLGGKHTEPAHFRLMINCAEICQTSANFMLSGSELHHLTCGVCAEVCRRCADDCERIGDMQECVEACRSCADSCARMAA